MYRWSWWQRRARRWWPALVVLATCLSLLASRLGGRGSKPGSTYSRPTFPTNLTPDDPPTPDPGLSTWVLVDAGGKAGTDVCGRIYSSFPPHWNILIYGTDKPDRNSVSRCRYVPDDVILKPRDPGNTVSARQRAFLYVVKSGAQAIYVPGGWRGQSPREVRPRVFTPSLYHGLIYASPTGTFNGIHHFGCRRNQQTRGSQTTPASHAPPKTTYRLCQHLEPPVLQVLAWLPVKPFDVQQEGSKRFISMDPCDKRAPPVTLENNILADIQLSEGLYSQNVFWALGVFTGDEPLSSNMSLLTGYAIQKLLMISGGYAQVRYGSIFERAKEQYKEVANEHLESARKAISQWTCGKMEMMACVRDLFNHLEGLRLVEQHLRRTIYLWLDALEEAGYTAPHPQAQSEANLGSCKPEEVVYHPVYLQGDVIWRRYRAQPELPLRHEKLIQNTLTDTCSGFTIKTHPLNPVNLTNSWLQLDNILLLVVFNNPFYSVIPYIETLYRPFFPYIVYCGPGIPDTKVFPQLNDYQITFLSYGGTPKGHFPGSFNYECVAMASRLHMTTDGYFVMSDDMFVSVSRLSEFTVLKPWFVTKQELQIGLIHKLRECRLGMCDFHTSWRWWEDYQKEILSVLSHLKSYHRKSSLIYKCHRQLVSVTGGEGRALGAYSDTFFIPEEYASDFAELTDIFLHYQVFLEVAVPTMLHCLELPERTVQMKGIPGFDLSRDRPHEHFNRKEFTGKTYLHPTKWSGITRGNRTLTELYCTKLLPHVHDPYGRLNE